MDWLAPVTLKVRVTLVAGAYVELPDWFAVMEQTPPPRSVTKPADVTEQTPAVPPLKDTGNPEDAVAETEKGAVPNTLSDGALKVIVCAAKPMLNALLMPVVEVGA